MIRRILRWTLRLLMGVVILSLAGVFFYRWIPIPFTPLMVIRSIEAITSPSAQNSKLRYDWASWEEISLQFPIAIIASEDQLFAEHNGFDFEAIEKAIEHNQRSKRQRGASTISQQVAKNVFLWPGRSWIRKGLEVGFTVMIEAFWPKKRILEVYMNIAELGPLVFGAEAAAQYHFGKSAKQLNGGEAALLAAVLPNPIKMNAGKPSGYVLRRKAHIQRQVGFFNGTEYLKVFTDKPVEKTTRKKRKKDS